MYVYVYIWSGNGEYIDCCYTNKYQYGKYNNQRNDFVNIFSCGDILRFRYTLEKLTNTWEMFDRS